MTATYTFDVFSSLDGFGAASGNWTGYWGKQGPGLLGHRLDLYSEVPLRSHGSLAMTFIIGSWRHRLLPGRPARPEAGQVQARGRAIQPDPATGRTGQRRLPWGN